MCQEATNLSRRHAWHLPKEWHVYMLLIRLLMLVCEQIASFCLSFHSHYMQKFEETSFHLNDLNQLKTNLLEKTGWQRHSWGKLAN